MVRRTNGQQDSKVLTWLAELYPAVSDSLYILWQRLYSCHANEFTFNCILLWSWWMLSSNIAASRIGGQWDFINIYAFPYTQMTYVELKWLRSVFNQWFLIIMLTAPRKTLRLYWDGRPANILLQESHVILLLSSRWWSLIKNFRHAAKTLIGVFL